MSFCGMAKNTVRNFLIIGGIVGLFYWLSKRTMDKISIGSPSMRVHKVSVSGIEFRILLPIINESDVPVDITGFIGQVFYNAGSLGVVNLVSPVSLPSFGQQTIEFSMKSGYLGTALELLNILTNGNPLDLGSINYKNVNWSLFTIKGTLKVEGLPLDIQAQLMP